MDSRWTLDNIRDNGHFAPNPLALSQREEMDSSNRFGPYRRIHRLMRGRYHLLLPTLALAIVIGGIYGWRKATPVYRSEGLIEVANRLPRVMNQTDQNEPLDMFEEFVQSQVLLISSRSVISLALADPNFNAALGNRHDMNVEEFVTNLVVEHPPRTQAIDITFVDPDPNVATKGVQALIAAFMTVSGKTGSADEDRRLAVLQERRSTLNNQIDAMKKQLAQIQPPSLLSIAMVDEMMRSLLQEQSSLETQLDEYLASDFGENRPQVKNARIRLNQVNEKILAYQNEVTVMQAATAATPPTDRRVAMLPSFLGYTEDIDALRTERDQVDQRIEALTTESSLGAERFRVLAVGDTPSVPYADRRPRMAALYGVAAGLVPLTLFFLLGLVDRRFRFSEDAAEILDNAPLLGVLPELPKTDGYPDLPRIAAYCVHNLRIRLQLLPGKKNDRVYMITSAAAGEGKTSLTLALGFSFAAAGKRVLLVDADLIGRGLTNRLRCEGQAGLLESVIGAGLSPIRHVMKNVSVLPAGIGGELGNGSSLPLDELAEVMNIARSRFDLILIDTGPVVASLQTPIVAQVADHVILTVSQGLQQVLCQRSMQILRSVGIKITGVVFNRARQKDYRRWIGGDSYYGSSSTSKWNAAHEDRLAEFGPLADPIAEADLAKTNEAATNGVAS